MLHPRDLQRLVICPTLEQLGLYSPAAANLLLATALAESVVGGWQRLAQLKGPALGLYQIEPATHRDVWRNFLGYRPALREKVIRFAAAGVVANSPPDDELAWNLRYATAIARIIYWRDPAALPAADNIEAMGKTWKRVYNTPAGAGRVEDFLHRVAPYRPFFLTETEEKSYVSTSEV